MYTLYSHNDYHLFFLDKIQISSLLLAYVIIISQIRCLSHCTSNFSETFSTSFSFLSINSLFLFSKNIFSSSFFFNISSNILFSVFKPFIYSSLNLTYDIAWTIASVPVSVLGWSVSFILPFCLYSILLHIQHIFIQNINFSYKVLMYL